MHWKKETGSADQEKMQRSEKKKKKKDEKNFMCPNTQIYLV